MSIRYRVRDLSQCQDLRLYILFESQHSARLVVFADYLKLKINAPNLNHSLRGKDSAEM